MAIVEVYCTVCGPLDHIEETWLPLDSRHGGAFSSCGGSLHTRPPTMSWAEIVALKSTREAEPNRLPPAERYARDAQFATLVNLMEQAIHACEYTPTEIREAAMLAAIRCEYHTIRRMRDGYEPTPACTCKNRGRQHEVGCWWHNERKDSERKIASGLLACGFTSEEIKKFTQEPPL